MRLRRRRREPVYPLRQFVLMDARAFSEDADTCDRATVFDVCTSIDEAIRRAPEYGDGNAIVVCRRTDEVSEGVPVYQTEATLTVEGARTLRPPT